MALLQSIEDKEFAANVKSLRRATERQNELLEKQNALLEKLLANKQ